MFGFSNFFRHAQRSSKWSSIRKNHLKDNPTCAACGKNKKLEVHHIEPVHINSDRELDPTNLVTLCDKPCHIIFGHLMDYKSWNNDVVQDCSTYLEKLKNKPIKY
jgi:5-methylcytosine-specific restriction endonuclease McrA